MGPEDILHLMFTCARAKQVWAALGLLEIIEEASRIDRSGSFVLEELLRRTIIVHIIVDASFDIALK